MSRGATLACSPLGCNSGEERRQLVVRPGLVPRHHVVDRTGAGFSQPRVRYDRTPVE